MQSKEGSTVSREVLEGGTDHKEARIAAGGRGSVEWGSQRKSSLVNEEAVRGGTGGRGMG